MKKLLFLILVLPMFFATGCGSNESNEPDSNPILGKPIKIETLEIAQNDFPNDMNWEKAKIACEKLGKGWRLPTIAELEFMYKNKDKIGGFKKAVYWSSTEGSGYAWGFYFGGGGARAKGDKGSALKGTIGYVRAVRTF